MNPDFALPCRFDADCDGTLTIDELHEMVTASNMAFGLQSDVADTARLLELLDVDSNQVISWQEWSHGSAQWLRDMGH